MSVDRFFTRLNPLIAFLLRSPLHPLLSRGLMLITVTGRRTGRRFSFPVGYQRESKDELTVMCSEARRKSWWKNYREPGPVELSLRGTLRSGTARVIAPESDDFRRCAEQTVRRVPGMARVFKIRYDRSTGLSEEQLQHLRQEIAAVRIQLDP